MNSHLQHNVMVTASRFYEKWLLNLPAP